MPSVLAARMSIVQDQIRGILAVPLQTEKSVIGLIYLDSPVLIKEFTRDDLNVLTVLANIAIDQATKPITLQLQSGTCSIKLEKRYG